MPNTTPIVLILAATLDYLIGDPWGWLHPVQVMGWIISAYTQWVTTTWKSAIARKIAGVFLGLGLILGSGGVGWLLVWGATQFHPIFGVSIATIILASCFAGRSLRIAAVDVLHPLTAGDLETARTKLSLYVGRDTEDLSPTEIFRAILETVAENTTDGVTAPLFYAIVGAFMPGVGSVPLALAYKAASTLDSMIGYKKEPYLDIGWFNAQLEDYFTWLPCRLTVLSLALLSGHPQRVISLCRRDATQDPSPNSGWSECAYAAVLQVQLGGKNSYGGVIKEKPLLGDATKPITAETVYLALGWMQTIFLAWLGLAIIGLTLANV
jgi:adenosylcobinamide-phosphate synthase